MIGSNDLPVQEPKAFPIPKDTQLPLFALVIGINDYQHVRKLRAAVTDANMIDTYLQQHLGVPVSRIINLRDKEATRKRIIQAFRDLQKHPDIKRQDAILIYFAGHGSEAEAPTSWEAGGSKIQVILPQDTGRKLSRRRVVQAIPDRTIAALLDQLAREKGDNITIIFDCCHSSSGTRDDEKVPERVARVVDFQGEFPIDLDQEIVKNPSNVADQDAGRGMSTPMGFLRAGLRSHVLLAACGAEELAWENHNCGAFTRALIETLIATGADKVTYTGLMQRLPNLPNQNPQCEGYNKERIFLNAKVPGANCFFVGVEQRDDAYILNSGIVQGVTVGSEFAIYPDHVESQSNQLLCTMRVKRTDASSADLEPLDETAHYLLPKPAYARQVACGPGNELRVHFSEACLRVVSVDALRRAALDAQEADIGFILAAEDNAEFLVDIVDKGNDKEAVFSTTHPFARDYDIGRLAHAMPATAEDISQVLRAAARWNWHLKRANTPGFGSVVRLEFRRLEQVEDRFDGHGMPIMKPVGEDMNCTGIIEMVVDPDHYFGIKIVNNSSRNLYPYLFYFDIKNQRIEPYYLGSTSGQRVDPPLRAGSSLTIGYGASGAVPFAFHLRDGEDIDVGFFKVFLTTSQAEFGALKQASPFENSRIPFSQEDMMKKLVGPEWDTVMATVVQRARPRPLEGPTLVLPDVNLVGRQKWPFPPLKHRLFDLLRSLF